MPFVPTELSIPWLREPRVFLKRFCPLTYHCTTFVIEHLLVGLEFRQVLVPYLIKLDTICNS